MKIFKYNCAIKKIFELIKLYEYRKSLIIL